VTAASTSSAGTPGGNALVPREHDRRSQGRLPSWRIEAARTTLWLVPTLLVLVSIGLFAATIAFDHHAYSDRLTLPTWLRTGDADAGRQVVIAIAAAVITVVGVVFSITILALTLASQQFGPRMMRHFIRDVGSQVTLGVFVATFVYAVLVLASITSGPRGGFVPHLSITVAEALSLVDVGVLIYFIHHIAKMIQLPEVIASIARDLHQAIVAEFPSRLDSTAARPDDEGRSLDALLEALERSGGDVAATSSGYLQHVGYAQLVEIAAHNDAVIRLTHRPGHFVVEGHPLAEVWPRTAAPQVAAALDRAHALGPHRTLLQDPVFAIDQLVEIAIRALSPAVNDTFTALTCIDWLSAGLSELSQRSLTEGVYRDQLRRIRLISWDPSYSRMVNRAFDKIRQCAGGMPAVLIRLLDAITAVTRATVEPRQRQVLARQGEMILAVAEATVREPRDLADVRSRHERLLAAITGMDDEPAAVPS
jgi:uncharacterized membrane protein